MRILLRPAVIALAAVALALLTAGAAGADDTGQTYAQVQKELKAQGYTVVQSTSIGDQVPQSECLVVKQLTTANGHVMLSLDCNKRTGAATP